MQSFHTEKVYQGAEQLAGFTISGFLLIPEKKFAEHGTKVTPIVGSDDSDNRFVLQF